MLAAIMSNDVRAGAARGDDLDVRPATRADIDLILAYLDKKADFDRATGAFTGALATRAR